MLALDVDTAERAQVLLDTVGPHIGAIKIGPRLNLKYGEEFVKKISKLAPVFVDNKYFDITSTVLASVQASFDSGASFVTVHALNGIETMSALANLESQLNRQRPFKILAVTLLTSWDQNNLPENFRPLTVSEHVVSLAQQVIKSGLSGIVCSGHELALLKGHSLFKVVPGIRLENDLQEGSQDQKRVMTPRQALGEGASALVIGRSILNSPRPEQTVLKILESINI